MCTTYLTIQHHLVSSFRTYATLPLTLHTPSWTQKGSFTIEINIHTKLHKFTFNKRLCYVQYAFFFFPIPMKALHVVCRHDNIWWCFFFCLQLCMLPFAWLTAYSPASLHIKLWLIRWKLGQKIIIIKKIHVSPAWIIFQGYSLNHGL